jgi:hypothetical protein
MARAQDQKEVRFREKRSSDDADEENRDSMLLM